jgi:hypothetical protein
MDDISKTTDKINKIYKNLTYFDQYGTDVIVCIILTAIVFITHAYFNILINMQPIKDNWVQNRCKPNIIPFAGMINKPDNMTTFEFTQQNFDNCMQDVLISITGFAVQPLTYITHILTLIYDAIAEAIQFIRSVFDKIRNSVKTIAIDVMSRISNIMIPLQQIIIAFRDTMEKIKGVMTTTLYTSLGTYYLLKSFLGGIVQLTIIMLIILAALIIAMWFIPFTWPIAAAATAGYIVIAAILSYMIIFLEQKVHVKTDWSIPGVPSRPRICFDKNTMIRLVDGSYKPIYKLTVGEKLYSASPGIEDIVTAKLRLNTNDEDMYLLNGVVVSSTHMVKYKDNWVPVLAHPDAKLIKNYKEPYLYCLNTTSKRIYINDMIFLDWDEIKDEHTFIPIELIHKHLDGGFVGSTMLSLSNNSKREIKDINIGDKLKGGEIVYGVVEIYGKDLMNQYRYNLEVSGGNNLIMYNEKTKKYTPTITNNCKYETIEKENILYHLLTNKKTLSIDKYKFCDYNFNVEFFINN